MKTTSEKSFTALELLKLANEAYADGFVDLSDYYTPEGRRNKEGTGDTLAEFIVIELLETFDDMAPKEAQLMEAMRAIKRAREQLSVIHDHLERRHDSL